MIKLRDKRYICGLGALVSPTVRTLVLSYSRITLSYCTYLKRGKVGTPVPLLCCARDIRISFGICPANHFTKCMLFAPKLEDCIPCSTCILGYDTNGGGLV